MTDKKDNLAADEASSGRLARLCEMTDAMFSRMKPAERDRMRQAHLAAARGPTRNLQLLCEMTDMLRELKAASRD